MVYALYKVPVEHSYGTKEKMGLKLNYGYIKDHEEG